METNGQVTQELEVIPSTAQTALYLITKAEVDTQIATAKAFPRSIKQFMDKAESIATVNEDVAASCNYALPRAGKTIEGPSVRLAEIVVSAYGNMRCGARVIDNDGKTITAQGICHDLETNNCMTVEVKRRITDRNGKTLSEDMQVVIGNAACAIAFRNAVYKVIPAALIEGIYEKTKEVAKGKAETMVKRRDKALEYARGLGITDEQITVKLGVKKVDDIDLDKLAVFRAILSGIKNGETTVQEAFGNEDGLNKNQAEESSRIREMIAKATDKVKLEKMRTTINKLADEKMRNELTMELAEKLDTLTEA